jgi:hypothetical protein
MERCPAPVLTSTGPLDRIPRSLDANHPGVEVDVEQLQAAQLSSSQATEEGGRPERPLAVRQRGEQLMCLSRGSIRSRRPRMAGMSRSLVASIAISSRRIARRKITHSGSTMLLIVDGERPYAPRSSAKSWISRRWTAES